MKFVLYNVVQYTQHVQQERFLPLISSELNQIVEIHFHVVSTTQRTTNDARIQTNRSIVLFLRPCEMD